MPISENETLFTLIGTTYGGDGQETFSLPNLQSRVPIHMGTGPSGTSYQIGELSGVEQVTLNNQQIPSHTHPVYAATTADVTTPTISTVFANESTNASGVFIYAAPGQPQAAMGAATVQFQGGSQPHENLQPYLCINFIISLFGVFPSPS